MAMSANGFIATKDFCEDFLEDNNWVSFVELANMVKCIIVGRKTYEVVKSWSDFNFDNVQATKIIVSKSKLELDKGYLHTTSPFDALEIAKNMGFEHVLLVGGVSLNTSFAKEKLIDELILNIDSVIVGQGIPLFKQDNFKLDLVLIDSKKINDKIIQIKYKIKN